MPEKSINNLHHALTIVNERCNGCTHCLSACPTRAIRVKAGKAVIDPGRCVDCGECYKVCPVSAIAVGQDDLGDIFRYPVRVILIPSVLIGEFSHKIPVSSIYAALKEIGFTHVYHVESSVELVLKGYNEFSGNTDVRPLISSFCPAIVRLIQVRFPSLVNNIVRVNPPIDLSAIYYREQLRAEGNPDESVGIFYATPCAAKIAAVKSPVGEQVSAVTGVINMNFLYGKIQQIICKPSASEQMPVTNDLLSASGILWSLTRGEARHFTKRALAVDGIRNVTEILESVENETLGVADFLELRACDEGCAGGILMTGNRFLTVERLRKLAADRVGTKQNRIDTTNLNGTAKHLFMGSIEPRNIDKLDEDPAVAMKKMERVRRTMCFLPGFDCGACGAPDCESLSEDIVNTRAGVSDCIFMQHMKLRNGTMSIDRALSITEKIWGTGRLEKNCNKPGAQDENF